MACDELSALLKRARAILERHLFEADGGAIRDDVAEVCMAIDDALQDETPPITLTQVERERSAA